jgi:hypothetical protein
MVGHNIIFVFLGKNVDSKIHEEMKDMISYLITRSYHSLQGLSLSFQSYLIHIIPSLMRG